MKKSYKNNLPKELEVLGVGVRVENGELIVDVEFKKKFDPKDGDFLVSNTGIFICKIGEKDNNLYAYAGEDNGKVCVDVEGMIWALRSNCRYAISEEKSAFLERLEKECNKRWNAEKKCIEDIYVPKYGDIVKVYTRIRKYKRNYMICIYPNKEFCGDNDFFEPPYISLNGNLILDDTAGSINSIISPALESEKKELFDKLAEVGKRWNPETKKLENIRWRAKKRESYYIINGLLDVVGEFAGAFPYEDVLHERGNYFRTPEAAQKVAEQIKDIFKNSKAE